MKQIAKSLILFLLVLTVTGCSSGNNRDRVNSENSVDKVISEQIGGDEPAADNAETQSPATKKNPEEDSLPEVTDTPKTTSVDYDLTAMSSDMVYATVYQMMADPDAYTGKTFRMAGVYYTTYYEPAAQYYHYCIIQDATACCAQGLEFVWGDGSHAYPDEYPAEGTEIVVQGTFETYTDEGDSYRYCRLKDASLESVL